ncbi:MAG: alpha/beta hydrolase [Gloeomargaritaceae cyanobacterium C42_A2020_066]|nr:alpha/beta hydrolase [Gloeomargaritaceae cyanobacterium C42_A2020_066]
MEIPVRQCLVGSLHSSLTRRPCLTLSGASLVTTLLALPAAPVLAASQVSLNFPSFNTTITVPVSELQTFAQTGQLSPSLGAFAKLAPPNSLNQLRTLLQEPFQLTPVSINRFSQSTTGQLLFEALGEFFQTSDQQNGQTALVTAFQGAAANPKGFSVLDVINNFPGDTININGPLSFRAITTIGQRLNDRSAILATIQQLSQTTPWPTLTNPTDLSKSGSTKWIKQTKSLDASPLGLKGSVPVDFYLPQGLTSPAPVVVISYGFASNQNTFAYLASHLASNGFVVAMPTYPYTSEAAISGFLTGTTKARNLDIQGSLLLRPRGTTLLLDYMQKLTETDPSWKQAVNLQQVGILGQSLGGYTALASAGASLDLPGVQQNCSASNFENVVLTFNVSLLFQCQLATAPKTINGVDVSSPNVGDARIKAVVGVNPLTSVVFGRPGMGQLAVPTILIAGDDDVFAPPVQEQINPFTWLTIPNRYLFVLKRGTHFSFLGSEGSQGGALPVPADLIGPSATLAQPALKAASLAFFRSYLQGQTQFLDYLNPTYLQGQVQPPFGVNFVRSLTAKQLLDATSTTSR